MSVLVLSCYWVRWREGLFFLDEGPLTVLLKKHDALMEMFGTEWAVLMSTVVLAS